MKIYEYILKIRDQGSTALKRFKDSFSSTDKDANKLNKTLGNVGRTMNWLKGIAVTVFAGALLSGIVTTTAKAQGLTNAITFASGSSEQAAINLAFLEKTSEDLGLSLEASQSGFKTLSAAMMGSSLQGQGTRDIFEGVSIGASAMGLTAEQAEGAFLALGQMMGKGKVQAEELRGQLGERIPGAFQIAARAMGMSTAKLDKLMQSGGLIAEEFLPKFAAEMKKTFGGALPQSVNSLQANLNRFNNRIYQTKVALGTTLLPIINAVLGKFNELYKFIKENADELKQVFAPLKALFSPLMSVLDSFAYRFAFVSNEVGDLAFVFNKIGNVLSFLEPVFRTLGELIGTVVEKIVNIGVALGNNQYFSGFVKMWVDTFVKIGTAAKNILGGIGDIVTGILSGDFSTIKAGFKSLGTGLLDTPLNPLYVIKTAKNNYDSFQEGRKGFGDKNFFKSEANPMSDLLGANQAGGISKPKEDSTGKKGIESIAGGGKQNININFEDVTLVGEMNFNGTLGENVEDVKKQLRQSLAEILNGAIYTARQ